MTWTTAGFAALVNADNTGTLPVECKYIALGTGTTAASAADTALESEIKRIETISGTVVDNNVIHVVLRDETSDTYQATEVGLIAADGTLLARYAQANPLIVKAAGAVALLAIDASFTDVDATQISFGDIQFINPPWGEDTQGVVQKASQAQAEAGQDNSVGMTPRLVSYLLQSAFGKTLLRDIVYPVGSVYIQFPDQSKPSDLFGGTWQLLFNNEGVFFRTEGQNASAFGSGIQTDALQEMTGNVYTRPGVSLSGTGAATGASGVFSYEAQNIGDGRTSSIGFENQLRRGDVVNFDASRVARTANETRPRNRTVRVWRRTL